MEIIKLDIRPFESIFGDNNPSEEKKCQPYLTLHGNLREEIMTQHKKPDGTILYQPKNGKIPFIPGAAALNFKELKDFVTGYLDLSDPKNCKSNYPDFFANLDTPGAAVTFLVFTEPTNPKSSKFFLLKTAIANDLMTYAQDQLKQYLDGDYLITGFCWVFMYKLHILSNPADQYETALKKILPDKEAEGSEVDLIISTSHTVGITLSARENLPATTFGQYQPSLHGFVTFDTRDTEEKELSEPPATTAPADHFASLRLSNIKTAEGINNDRYNAAMRVMFSPSLTNFKPPSRNKIVPLLPTHLLQSIRFDQVTDRQAGKIPSPQGLYITGVKGQSAAVFFMIGTTYFFYKAQNVNEFVSQFEKDFEPLTKNENVAIRGLIMVSGSHGDEQPIKLCDEYMNALHKIIDRSGPKNVLIVKWISSLGDVGVTLATVSAAWPIATFGHYLLFRETLKEPQMAFTVGGSGKEGGPGQQ